jgi:anti-sigma factor RsiW
MKPSDADLLLILDYLDGKLSQAEGLAFELRLSEEPELAAERDELERMDHLQRAAAVTPQKAQPAPVQHSSWRRALVAVAATVAVVFAARWLVTSTSIEPELHIAILASGPTLPEHNAALGLDEADARKVPPGFGLRAGAGAGKYETVPVEEYLALTTAPARERVRAALAEGATSAAAKYFVVPLRSAQDASAVVLLVDADGASVAYPVESPWSAASGRLAGGRDHVLPGPVVTRDAGDADALIEYAPGFRVPRRAGELLVLVGLRAEPLDEALRSELRGATEAMSSPDDLATWLTVNGFLVTRLTAREE